jgi:hypothetical protein
MPVSVNVMPRYVRLARKLAADRNRSFEENDTWDNDVKTYGVEAEKRNFRGLMGEFAFAEYADLTVDTAVYDMTDGGVDFTVEYEGDRCTFDTKTAQSKPYAIFVKDGCVSADYYIQGHLDNRTVKFLGMATREEVLSTELSETPYDHRNHEIPVEELDAVPTPEALKSVG